MASQVLGFDFGACELKIAQADGKRIKSLVSVPMPDSMVRGGVIVSYDAMGDFIKETLKANKLSGKYAAVILPGHYAFLRRITLPLMDVNQLAVNLPFEFRDFLTQSKDKYFYDYQVNGITKKEEKTEAAADDDSIQGDSMDITAAAIAKSVIEDYRAMFKRAGLKLKTAIPAECAYQNIIRMQPDYSGKEYCFLDLGHTATRINIFNEDIFDTNRTIDIGLESADHAISEGCNVDIHVARTYKHSNYSNCLSSEGCRSIYDAIGGEVRKAINFYGFSNRESHLEDAYICGGGMYIEDLDYSLKQNVELNFHSAGELVEAFCDGQSDAFKFAEAIGAAIQ